MKHSSFFLAILFFIIGCSPLQKSGSSDDHQFDLTLLAMNDVYEIGALGGGTVGGLARVATIRKQLLKENPNTLTLHAGDFLNPSLIGNLKHNGKKIKGAQMVDVMNQIGIDWVVPGNHEFDLKRNELQERINESTFGWVVGNAQENISDGSQQAFLRKKNGKKEFIPEYVIQDLVDADGTKISVGIVAVTIPFDVKKYATITDPIQKTEQVLAKMTDCDVIIGLTHLDWKEDIKIANAFPQIDLIIGGHDHYNMLKKTNNANVTKADANARTVYIHRIHIDTKSKQKQVISTLKAVDTTIAFDPQTQQVVEKWQAIGRKAVIAAGIDPTKVLISLKRPLDGREVAIRDHATGLGELIASAMLAASEKKAVAAFFNAGSVRLDDYWEGDITGSDIMRTLPYGGVIFDIEIEGGTLRRALEIGKENRGKGGFFQLAQIVYKSKEKAWYIAGEPLQDQKKYMIVSSDFLFQGRESGLDFLNPKNPAITIFDHKKDSPLTDIRKAVADYLLKK